ncbi:flagellar basal body rod protein FlgB [Enterococcus italicus]|uniref:flagellar basal body rod protein FlgB n=1 Tax=Enterococcus italicus TaxID=246144 RepID=UPI0028A84D73|nr:flagellar basal body rod protein FlgB [Enterococcus italicus]
MDNYNLIKDAMSISSKRANLISSNIANVNTANYKVKRIEFEDLLNQSMKEANQLTITNERHIQKNSNVLGKVTERSNLAIKENGNNVDLDVEMLNQSTNALYYSALTAQLNGRLSMYNTVTSS